MYSIYVFVSNLAIMLVTATDHLYFKLLFLSNAAIYWPRGTIVITDARQLHHLHDQPASAAGSSIHVRHEPNFHATNVHLPTNDRHPPGNDVINHPTIRCISTDNVLVPEPSCFAPGHVLHPAAYIGFSSCSVCHEGTAIRRLTNRGLP